MRIIAVKVSVAVDGAVVLADRSVKLDPNTRTLLEEVQPNEPHNTAATIPTDINPVAFCNVRSSMLSGPATVRRATVLLLLLRLVLELRLVLVLPLLC